MLGNVSYLGYIMWGYVTLGYVMLETNVCHPPLAPEVLFIFQFLVKIW